MHSSSRPPSALHSSSSSMTLNSTQSDDIGWQDPIKLPPPAPSRIGRSHQRSRTAAELPPLFTNTSIFSPFRPDKSGTPTAARPESPTHEIDDLDFADEERSGIRLEPKPNKIASWFSGTSRPISIGLIPSPSKEQSNPFGKKNASRDEKEDEEEEEADEADEAEAEEGEEVMEAGRQPQSHNIDSRGQSNGTPAKLQKRTAASPTRMSQATSSRFSFFRAKPAPETAAQPQLSDELSKLNIKTALFPAGPAHEFSPAAFMNLQMNAEGTIQKFQSAYTQAIRSLREVTSERNVQKDELEASQTANEALKMQLADMAEKAMAHEDAMRRLMEELAVEKQKRKEEEEFRKRSLKLVSPPPEEGPETPKRLNRVSQISSVGESEADSEVASSAESIFSQPVGYPVDMSRTNSVASATPVTQHSFSQEIGQRPCFSPSPSTSSKDRRHTMGTVNSWSAPEDCEICHGIASSEAWDILGVLKEENKALKASIEHLESGLDASLDLLYGLA